MSALDPLTPQQRREYTKSGLAPAPGGNVILPPPGLQSMPSAGDAAATIEDAGWLHAVTTSVASFLAEAPNEDEPDWCRERGQDLANRHTVGAILSLWEEIPCGRRNLETWGDELINARCAVHGPRGFQCVRGEFGSATHAIQDLAETILVELWIEAYEARGNPSLRDELPWTRNSAYRPFCVDWWHTALPVLRRECGYLCAKYGLEAVGSERRCMWKVGLVQDWTAVNEYTRIQEMHGAGEMVKPTPSGDKELRQFIEARSGGKTRALLTHLFANGAVPRFAIRDTMNALGYPKASQRARRAFEKLVERSVAALAEEGLLWAIKFSGETVYLVQL
jgi:hypothetical protein